jgi:hypothetical protein
VVDVDQEPEVEMIVPVKKMKPKKYCFTPLTIEGQRFVRETDAKAYIIHSLKKNGMSSSTLCTVKLNDLDDLIEIYSKFIEKKDGVQ